MRGSATGLLVNAYSHPAGLDIIRQPRSQFFYLTPMGSWRDIFRFGSALYLHSLNRFVRTVMIGKDGAGY
jgi:hypothetical protein